MSDPKNYESILLTPDVISQNTVAYLEDRRKNAAHGVSVGLAGFDKDFLPLYKGEVCSLLARPGCGKTGFMVRWARERAKWLRDQKIDNRIVMYITLEQTVEELNAFNMAADERVSITNMARGTISESDWNRCLKSSVERMFWPLWNIGYSSMTQTKQIRIDADAIEGALNIARDKHKKEIDIVFVDYLQRIPLPRGAESKSVGVSENLDLIKTMAMRTIHAPFVVGVQASREVDEYADKIPELGDGQWTSNIEQTSDRIIALMRPAKYWQEGSYADIDLLANMRISKEILAMYVLKQKLGKDNFPYLAKFEPEYNILDELEIKKGR